MGKEDKGVSERWGEFRFSIIGALLSAPPDAGEIRKTIEELAVRTWRHPITGVPVQFGASTIERWYYAARNEKRSPLKRLQRKVRSDLGSSRCMTREVKALLHAQYEAHPSWSIKLLADNLKVALEARKLPCPAYPTIVRYMRHQGLTRRLSRGSDRAGMRKALSRLEGYEVRSFETDFVGALFHLDFHYCSRQILHPHLGWVSPIALCVMDDCSRFICHLQWYLNERTEDLVHGVCQAFLKVGLPRSLMSDNGAAMVSDEFSQGMLKVGILHATTLPYSPYQNGKQERLFGSLEGRLIAMLEGAKDLSLQKLNETTQAWIEIEYHRTPNRELGVSPARKYLDTKHVLRPAPSLEELRMAFRKRVSRTQRKSDGTISIEGKRFEIPSAYRSMRRLSVDYASWELGLVHIVDNRTGTVLCSITPVDKSANASGERRKITHQVEKEIQASGGEEPPLLQKILQEYAATGVPPSYIPKDNE
jgi:transposase InsO family protein